MNYRTILGAAAVAIGALVVVPRAQAQAWNYPSFQVPRTEAREFNFAIADGGNCCGTSLLAQWREGIDPKNHIGLDLGFANPDGDNNNVLFFGGHFGHQITTSTPQMPLDLMFVAGLNYARMDAPAGVSKPHLLRIPVGVSLGHVFPMQGGMSITPYASPRVMIEKCGNCGNNDTKINLNVELGADWKFTPQLSGRLGIEFDGSDFLNDDAFGISLAWHPLGH